MATLQIDLPDPLRAAAEARAVEAGFGTVDAYVASLIEADQAVRISAELEAELLAGLSGPARELTAADWDEKRRRLRGTLVEPGAS